MEREWSKWKVANGKAVNEKISMGRNGVNGTWVKENGVNYKRVNKTWTNGKGLLYGVIGIWKK